MNKDVIYIEPEDDITDIITKIENSKEKIVALVPPKKAGVFRSVVNIKLIAKVGFTADKTIVLVTTDPSITKLAGATKIPVTKNLQTPPSVPNPITGDLVESTSKEELVEEDNGEVTSEEVPEEEKPAEEADDKETKKEDEKEPEEKEKAKKSDKDDKKAKAKKFSFAWFKNHKTITICSIIGVLLVIIFFIWAFAIAPAATITVGIRTTSSNFSKSASFTKKVEEENIEEGRFFLTEKSLEKEASVEFEATGQKNVGEKAKGNVVIYAYFSDGGSVTVKAGSKFTLGEYSYLADSDATLTWDGNGSSCENKNSYVSGGKISCKISGRVNVTAEGAGENYNIAASAANWKTNANVSVYSDAAMAGGTNKMVTIVSQEDVDKAKNQLVLNSESENKEALMDTLADTDFPIESSFKQTTSEVVSTPAVGEQIKEGETPKITVKITDTIYLIDKTKVEEYITNEAKLSDNFKIYQMNDPFVENFIETSEGFTGKIKTSYVSGPKVTENDVIEIVKGKGLGNAQHDLKDVDGVSRVDIKTSFPWVMNIPSDTNKITVILDMEQK